jgi:hypothetical protein
MTTEQQIAALLEKIATLEKRVDAALALPSSVEVSNSVVHVHDEKVDAQAVVYDAAGVRWKQVAFPSGSSQWDDVTGGINYAGGYVGIGVPTDDGSQAYLQFPDAVIETTNEVDGVTGTQVVGNSTNGWVNNQAELWTIEIRPYRIVDGIKILGEDNTGGIEEWQDDGADDGYYYINVDWLETDGATGYLLVIISGGITGTKDVGNVLTYDVTKTMSLNFSGSTSNHYHYPTLNGASEVVIGSTGDITFKPQVGSGSSASQTIKFGKDEKFYIKPQWYSGGATWINMPTDGPSGLGSGGEGTDPWIAFVAATNQWFTGAAIADIAYRNTKGALRFGNDSGNAAMSIIGNDVIFTDAGGGLLYGAAYGKDIAWTQASAAQNTWYKVSDVDMVDGPLNLITHDGSGKLTVTKAGTYKIDMAISHENNGTDKHTEYGVSIDGASPTMYQREFCATILEEQHGSLSRIITLTANQTIELAIRTTDTGTPTLTVNNLSITVVMIGG